MIPTFVFGWPTGHEEGKYLAIDLGGTNLRVCLVHLQGGSKYEITQSKFRITEEQKHAEDGQELFDWCAERLKDFVLSNVETGSIGEGEVLPLGFTVSYLSLYH
jgi:hexokinase